MTVKELREALSGLDDEKYVFIRRLDPDGVISQIVLQGITQQPPWHGAKDDKSNWLVGLVCTHDNSEIRETDARKTAVADWGRPTFQ